MQSNIQEISITGRSETESERECERCRSQAWPSIRDRLEGATLHVYYGWTPGMIRFIQNQASARAQVPVRTTRTLVNDENNMNSRMLVCYAISLTETPNTASSQSPVYLFFAFPLFFSLILLQPAHLLARSSGRAWGGLQASDRRAAQQLRRGQPWHGLSQL